MVTTATPAYGSTVVLTHTLASLASDANLAAGRESNSAAQQTTDDAVDCLVQGKIMTGTSPTAAKQIEVWLAGSYDNGTTYSGGATGADANLTIAGDKTLLKLLTVIPTVSTSNLSYNWGPFSVAQAFGGIVPPKWNVFVVHNTGVALNATGGNHVTAYVPVKFESI